MIDKRMMYAQGQRVRFRGGGMDMGNESNQSQSASMGNSSSSNGGTGNGGTGNGGTGNGGNDGPRGPQELGTSTRTVNRITAPPAYEIIGGEKFDVTPDTRDERNEAKAIVEKARVEKVENGNLLNSFLPGDNPLSKPKFSMGNLLFNAGMFAISPALFAKYQKGKRLYSGAKLVTDTLSKVTGKNVSKPFEIVEGLTENIGLKDKNVIKSFKDSFTNNLTSKTKTKTKPVITANRDNDSNDGIASLEDANVLQDEYSILFQKLQTGNISDAERTRYTMLKNMLGI